MLSCRTRFSLFISGRRHRRPNEPRLVAILAEKYGQPHWPDKPRDFLGRVAPCPRLVITAGQTPRGTVSTVIALEAAVLSPTD